jgi:hypothetical protein
LTDLTQYDQNPEFSFDMTRDEGMTSVHFPRNGGHMLLEKDHRRLQYEVLSLFERPDDLTTVDSFGGLCPVMGNPKLSEPEVLLWEVSPDTHRQTRLSSFTSG